MPTALFADSFVRSNHQYGRVRPRCAGDHVLQELLVPRRVDDDVFAPLGFEPDLGRVDRNVLFLLFEQRIEHERELKFHSLRRARLLHHLDLAFRKTVRVMQDSSDESGLPMIHMAHKHDSQRNSDVALVGLSWTLSVGR